MQEGIFEQNGVTDSARGDTQRMTLPLIIHLIEAADMVGGLRRAAVPAPEASMACPNAFFTSHLSCGC